MIPYRLEDMSSLAKNVAERSIAIPGVQSKLSMSMVNNLATKETSRLNVVGAPAVQKIVNKSEFDEFENYQTQP